MKTKNKTWNSFFLNSQKNLLFLDIFPGQTHCSHFSFDLKMKPPKNWKADAKLILKFPFENTQKGNFIHIHCVTQ